MPLPSTLRHPVVRKVGRFFAPQAQKNDDGRDMWPSRTAFIFAGMGGAIGLGNLLRYPSVVFANSGLQWFIPYLIALFIIAVPALSLEIGVGQANRGGTMIAHNQISRRLRGTSLAIILNGYIVAVYYVPIMAWVMVYFQHSFRLLPWAGEKGHSFYIDRVIANKAPTPAEYANPADNSGAVIRYAHYPATGIVGTTLGWTSFVWFVTWLCMFKGVALTGRAVYFTIGIPIVALVVLIGRAVSLPHAIDGIRIYCGEWHGEKLASGAIWQAAAGQIFFSIGVGFGYFTSYASYNAKYSNALQDALIIACSNSAFEVIGAFAAFGIIGNLDLKRDAVLGTFTLAFLTYPQAISAMPGANFWAVFFFSVLFLLGLSSAVALTESIITMCCDTEWGARIPRPIICTVWIIISFLLSMVYCTEFGFYFLDAVDTYINNCSLLFAVCAEVALPMILYRRREVHDQVGWLPWCVYQVGYVGGLMGGVAIAHGHGDARIGAGVGFGFFILASIVATLMARTPMAPTPGFWGGTPLLARFWWLAFYSGHQLTRDLNVVIGQGRNWKLPCLWAPLLRYISAPVLFIIYGFVYKTFYKNRGDLLHIVAFALAHFLMVLVVLGFILPRWLGFLIPPPLRSSDMLQYAMSPGVDLNDVHNCVVTDDVMRNGSGQEALPVERKAQLA